MKRKTCCGQITLVKNRQNLPINNPKPDLHNINAHTVWWKSIDIYSSYHPEMQIRMDIWQADGHTDSQCDTIIPHHYHVAGYKNDHFIQTKIHRLYRKMTIYGHFSNGHFSTYSIYFLFGYNTFKFTFKSSYIWNLTMNRLIKRSQCTKICWFFVVVFFFLILPVWLSFLQRRKIQSTRYLDFAYLK